MGFLVFNLIAYSLLLAELYTLHYVDDTEAPHLKNFYIHVFNGCYAVLLFIVVTFFLIYGVQVFFKVKGGFLIQIDKSDKSITDKDIFRSKESLIDTSQLHQSRIGLLSQSLMLTSVAVFLSSETLSELWNYKVPLYSRNWHDLMFRLVEIGVTLWFPCVLWNCMSPEQLWILNPKRIIKSSEEEEKDSVSKTLEMTPLPKGDPAPVNESEEGETQCFVCTYPCDQYVCNCRFAHDQCICLFGQKEKTEKLIANERGETTVVCDTCRVAHPLRVCAGKLDWARLARSRPFLWRAALLVGAVAGCAYAFARITPSPPLGSVTIGLCFFLIYVSARNLWAFTDSSWQEARKEKRKVWLDREELARLNEAIRLKRAEGREEKEATEDSVTVQLIPAAVHGIQGISATPSSSTSLLPGV